MKSSADRAVFLSLKGHLQSSCVHTPAWLSQTATQAAVPFPSAAFTPTFSSGKRLWFLSAIRSQLRAALLCPCLALHNSSTHSCATRRRAPERAHLIWIKDVFWFSFIRQGRTCITQSSAAHPCVCFSPDCHSGCFTLRALSLALAVDLYYLSSEIQNSSAKFPLFFNSRDPLTAARYGQALANLEDTCASWLPSLPPVAALLLLAATRITAKVPGGEPRPNDDS